MIINDKINSKVDGELRLIVAMISLIIISLFLPSRFVLAQQNPPSLKITSPADGTIVAPGQTIVVKVEIAAGVTFPSGVAIVAEKPIPMSNIKISPPYNFFIQIPKDIQPGKYNLTAGGLAPPKDGVDSNPVSIDVEFSDNPIKLQAGFGNNVISELSIDRVGEELPLQILGVYSSGTFGFELNGSSYLSFSSSNTAIATVDSTGMVSAVSPGNATVIATYSHANPPLKLIVPIIVPPQVITLSPWFLSFDPLPVGRTSDTQIVTLTSTKQLNKIKISTAGYFSEMDNCSVVPTTTCSINVKFSPSRAGSLSGNLNIDTDWDSTSINLTGTGAVIPFAAFNPTLTSNDENPYQLSVKGTFTLGQASKGIDPQNENIILTIGTFSVTIPKSSFKKYLIFPDQGEAGTISSNNAKFYFEGHIDKVNLNMTIEPTGQGNSNYKFDVNATDPYLLGLDNPAAISLLIGDNMGVLNPSSR